MAETEDEITKISGTVRRLVEDERTEISGLTSPRTKGKMKEISRTARGIRTLRRLKFQGQLRMRAAR